MRVEGEVIFSERKRRHGTKTIGKEGSDHEKD